MGLVLLTLFILNLETVALLALAGFLIAFSVSFPDGDLLVIFFGADREFDLSLRYIRMPQYPHLCFLARCLRKRDIGIFLILVRNVRVLY